MKKAVFCLILGWFVIFTGQNGFAASQCFELSPFIDVMKVSVTAPDSAIPANKLLIGVWYAPGSYWEPITGTQVKDSDGVSKRFSVHATRASSYYDCILDATLDPTLTPIQGPFVISCAGESFTNSGTLIKVKCNDLPPYSITPLTQSESALPGGK
jgi:hypothetical protein